MGIEDIQISEELQTNAPSIRYRGDEGPRSPQQEQQMMEQQMMEQQMMAGEDYSSSAYRNKLIQQLMDTGGLDFGSASNEADRIIKIKLKPRKKAAYGGIMGVDGRKKYGWGSWYQENIADPYKKYVLQQSDEKIKQDSQDRVDQEDEMFGKNYENPFDTFLKGTPDEPGNPDSPRTGGQAKNILPAIGGALAGLFTKGTDPENPGKPDDNTALALDDLKKSANILTQEQGMAANLNFLLDEDDRKFSTQQMVDTYANAANGGRIGFNMGGGADMDAPQMNAAGAKEMIVAEIMQKLQMPNVNDQDRAILQEQLRSLISQPQMPMMGMEQMPMMAQGGRIGFRYGKTYKDATEREKLKEILKNKDIEGLDNYSTEELMSLIQGLRPNTRMNLRPGKAEGGIMDLGGMEKDYRAEGGFVPIGKKEKADDVPARLSVNEFVFTADAVRNAGGGDIDQGAQVMENMMKHLEQGGQVSEESQGMQGARDMFATSQRLGEVV
jgi:hypothetical protein